MVGYEDGSRTILTAIPTVPPSFTNISKPMTPGTYLLGHTEMKAANIPITSFWHQAVSKQDDIILGVLTIVLIGLISDIVKSILLRTRRSSIRARAIRTAYAIDQFSRFRLIRFPTREPRFRCSYLFAFTIAISLFTTDVVFVLLTQQSVVHSTENQYNIVAFQPVGTTRGRATFIRRLAGDRQCMTPLIREAKQRRNYAISACIHTAFKEPSERYARETDFVAMRSWYHRGGSDHNITFGDGWYFVSVRGYLYVDSDEKGGKHVLFNTSANIADAYYVQEVVMYGSMEWACNDENGAKALQSCEEVVRSLSIKRRDIVGKDIVLWRGDKGNVEERVRGAVTRFEVSLKEPFQAVNSGIRALFTSGVMYEVEGSGAYALINDGITRESGITGLISEEGRVAGVWLMCTLLGLLTVMMLTLRVILRPTTLGEVAIGRTGMDMCMEDRVVDIWEEEEREMVRKRITQRQEIAQEKLKVEDEVSSICSSVDSSYWWSSVLTNDTLRNGRFNDDRTVNQ